MKATLPLLAALSLAVACSSSNDSSGPGVTSTDTAKEAYLGLDASIDRALTLAIDGYNNPTSGANITPQTGNGTKAGTMVIAGQVSRGVSDNRSMNLTATLTAYSDDGKLTYDTPATALPVLKINLSNVPNGTLDGTLDGDFDMTGALVGKVTLAVTFSGAIQPLASDATKVERKPGTTHIQGTAKSGDATYAIDVTR